jgi:hypothetical protein
MAFHRLAGLIADLEATRWTGRPGYPLRGRVYPPHALGFVKPHIAQNSLVAVARILGPTRWVAGFSPGRDVAVAGPSGVFRGTLALVCVSHSGWALALLKMLATDRVVLGALTQFVANEVHPRDSTARAYAASETARARELGGNPC